MNNREIPDLDGPITVLNEFSGDMIFALIPTSREDNEETGTVEINYVLTGFVRMVSLSKDLQLQVRKELGLA